MSSFNRRSTTVRRFGLDGVRVGDFSWIVAGPTCTRILADFGAGVTRVEFEQTLDYSRHIPPVLPGASPNMSGSFDNLNRNKLSTTFNVMHPCGWSSCAGSFRCPTWWSGTSARGCW